MSFSMHVLAMPILRGILHGVINYKLNDSPGENDGQVVFGNMTKEQLEAYGEKMLGNPFPQLLFDIKRHVDVTVGQLKLDIEQTILSTSILSEFRGMQNEVHDLYCNLERWLEFPDDTERMDRFLQKYRSNVVPVILKRFHHRITGNNGETKLTDDIWKVCNGDWKLNYKWHSNIWLMILQLGTVQAAYISYQLEANINNNTRTDNIANISRDLPPEILAEIQTSQQANSEILSELMDSDWKARAYFLYAKCAKEHRDCGAKSDEECCQLGAKIYKLIGAGKSAEQMAEILRQDYPQFQWSTIKREVKLSEIRYSQMEVSKKNESLLWLQYLGSEETKQLCSDKIRELLAQKRSITNQAECQNLIKAYNVLQQRNSKPTRPQFGCFICHRLGSRKVCTVQVFWGDGNTIRKTMQSIISERERYGNGIQPGMFNKMLSQTFFQLSKCSSVDRSIGSISSTRKSQLVQSLQSKIVLETFKQKTNNMMVISKEGITKLLDFVEQKMLFYTPGLECCWTNQCQKNFVEIDGGEWPMKLTGTVDGQLSSGIICLI